MISIKRSNSLLTLVFFCILGLCFISPARSQETPPATAAPTPAAPATPPATGEANTTPADKSKEADKDKQLTADEVIKESMKGNGGYVFGVLPNYRTTNVDQPVVPLKPKEKMLIAFKDSFAPTIYFVTARVGPGDKDLLHRPAGS